MPNALHRTEVQKLLMLREYFLRSLSRTVAALPIIPAEEDIATAVTKLVELFRALEAPPRTSLQGLWCELFLIGRAPNIRQAALEHILKPVDK